MPKYKMSVDMDLDSVKILAAGLNGVLFKGLKELESRGEHIMVVEHDAPWDFEGDEFGFVNPAFGTSEEDDDAWEFCQLDETFTDNCGYWDNNTLSDGRVVFVVNDDDNSMGDPIVVFVLNIDKLYDGKLESRYYSFVKPTFHS